MIVTDTALPTWRQHFEHFEGRVNHFYLDGEGIVTVGIGCEVFEPSDLSMLRKRDRVPASSVELVAEYRAIKMLPSGRLAEYYARCCLLFMDDSVINSLFRSRLDEGLRMTEAEVTQLTGYPESAILAVVDMTFTLGAAGLVRKFPHFTEAFRRKDWHVCSQECKREGIQTERNEWTRQIFETLEKATV